MLDAAVSGIGPEAFAVRLTVHDGARQQRFVDLLDCLAAQGVRRVSLGEAGRLRE